MTNPVNFTDPTGHCVFAIAGALAIGSMLVGGIMGGISAAAAGENILAGVAGGAVTGLVTGIGIGVTAVTGGAAVPILAAAGGIGSFLGNATSQVISGMADDNKSFRESFESVDYVEAGISGLVGVGTGIITGGIGNIFASSLGSVNGVQTAMNYFSSGSGALYGSALLETNKALWMGFYGAPIIENFTFNSLQNGATAIVNYLAKKGSSNTGTNITPTTKNTPSIQPTPTPKINNNQIRQYNIPRRFGSDIGRFMQELMIE